MNSDFLMHYGIPQMKWGVRRFQEKGSSKRTSEGKIRYAHSEKGLASKLYQSAAKAEPKITKDVVQSIKRSGAKSYGLKNRLKTESSLKRKIATDAEEKNISLTKAANRINDAIRYTAVMDDDRFADGYESIKADLENHGYTEVKCTNYFDKYRQGKSKHKQVTSVYENANGERFELQFHTPSSIKVKETKTPIYEEARQLTTSASRKAELEKQMDALAKQVKTPKGVYGIKSHG